MDPVSQVGRTRVAEGGGGAPRSGEAPQPLPHALSFSLSSGPSKAGLRGHVPGAEGAPRLPASAGAGECGLCARKGAGRRAVR